MHLALLRGLGLQARVLDLGGGHVGEGGQKAQVRLLEGPVTHAAVHVDEAHDFAAVLERGREHRLDAG